MEQMIQLMVMAAAFAACFLTGSPEKTVWIPLAGMLAVFAVALYFRSKQEREIERLITYLMRLQDKLEVPELSRQGEGRLGVLQSEIYKLVTELNEKSDIASGEKRYLADMLSDISHQIKTPLAAIGIMTDLLRSPGLSQEKRLEFISNIDREASRITWLIRNLLTLSQLEAGVLKLKKERISAKELLERAMQPLELMAEVGEVELSLDAPPGIPLSCDIHWTVEALSNVIKNCLEHTPPGGRVCIRASQNNFSANICIEDNGEGISREDLPHIFERFYKAKGADASSVGIGLALTRRIVLLQNGTISVQSEKGKGTSFLVKLYREG